MPIKGCPEREPRSLDSEDLIEIIITPKPAEGLEKNLAQPAILRRNPEESQEDYDKKSKAYNNKIMRPLVEYLDRLGARYQPMPNLGTVIAYMKAGDIPKLKEQPFVGYAARSCEIRLIE